MKLICGRTKFIPGFRVFTLHHNKLRRVTTASISHTIDDYPQSPMLTRKGSFSGIRVNAYDFEPPDSVENVSFPRVGKLMDVWHHVGDLDEFDANAAGQSDYVLFLCWPPGWGNAMAVDALAAFEKAGGERLIFMGQPKGGMTGNDAFFDALSAG
jgi:hypothetical protein